MYYIFIIELIIKSFYDKIHVTSLAKKFFLNIYFFYLNTIKIKKNLQQELSFYSQMIFKL